MWREIAMPVHSGHGFGPRWPGLRARKNPGPSDPVLGRLERVMKFKLTTFTLGKAVRRSIHKHSLGHQKGQIIVQKQYSNGGKELL